MNVRVNDDPVVEPIERRGLQKKWAPNGDTFRTQVLLSTPHFADKKLQERTFIKTDTINVLNDAGVCAIFIDANMRVTYFTDHAAIVPNLIWLDRDRPLAHIFANQRGCDELLIAAQCALDHPAARTAQLLTPTGNWLEATVRPCDIESTGSTRAVITLVDITEVKRLRLALHESQEKYRTLVEWSLEAIHIHRDGRFIYLNPAALQLYGATSGSDMIGKLSRDRVHPDDLPMATARLQELLQHQVNAPLIEMRFLKLDGSVIEVQAQATLTDYEGAPAVQVAWRDITEQKRTAMLQRESQDRMQIADDVLQLAFQDMLTGLPNRRVLVDRVNQTRLESKRSGRYAALLLLDLDNFKPLNDTYGHAAGDGLLIEVGRRLRQCVRETDLVVRFGGDEFVVLLNTLSTDLTASAQLASTVAQKISESLKQPYWLEVRDDKQVISTVEHRCTASIGMALFVNGHADHDEILKWADSAMYKAKKTGKNRVYLHDPNELFNSQIGL
jgi:diguanylate cyclase (GGDEF)-like protein/PAS domain S-box-containing protein